MTDVQAPPPPPLAPLSTKDARAQGKAAKAYNKAQRPFYKKKRYIVPAAVIVVIIAIAAAGGGGGDSKKGVSAGVATTVPGAAPTSDKLYPNRPDAQGDDHEAAIGQAAELRGRTATVTSAVFQSSLSRYENDGYIVANVTILNRNNDAQSYNMFDWKVQTPEGQVLDATFTTADGDLASGDLVKGGTVSGNVTFKVGEAPHGEFYIIYKPDPFAADRGIWGLTIP